MTAWSGGFSRSSASLGASCCFFTGPLDSRTSACHREISLKHQKGTGPGRTASASTTSGGSALPGVTAMHSRSKSLTTTKHQEMTMRQAKRLDPIHPGEILLEDFMRPLGISINQLARDLDVPPNRISAIVNGTRSITADTALRLGTYFHVSPETWLGCRSITICVSSGSATGTGSCAVSDLGQQPDSCPVCGARVSDFSSEEVAGRA